MVKIKIDRMLAILKEAWIKAFLFPLSHQPTTNTTKITANHRTRRVLCVYIIINYQLGLIFMIILIIKTNRISYFLK
jgi:hypothetical protein